jgi:preprotein translocase subunit YajC
MPGAVRGHPALPGCRALRRRRGIAGPARASYLPLSLETLLFISSAFAQTAPAAAGGGDMLSSLGSMLPLLLMFVVLYFVMIRPQMKRQKEARAMLEALAKGDEVATAGGLLGKINVLGDQYLSLEIANGVEVKVQRSSVVQVLPKGTIK